MVSFVIMVLRLLVISMCSELIGCQVLSTCLLPIYNQECDINCTTPDRSGLIIFYKLPDATNPVAQCFGNNCAISNSNFTSIYSINATDDTTSTLRIHNLSWDDKGTWRCDYGTSKHTAVVGFAKYPDDIEYSGLSNNSEISSGTEMTITMKCLYTDLSRLVTLIYLRDGDTFRSNPVSCTDVTPSCANSNFVSKSCTPKVQLESGVACGANYSIEIAVSVLGNEEETYSAFTGIAITCTSTTPKSITTQKPSPSQCGIMECETLGSIIGITGAVICVVILIIIIYYKRTGCKKIAD